MVPAKRQPRPQAAKSTGRGIHIVVSHEKCQQVGRGMSHGPRHVGLGAGTTLLIAIRVLSPGPCVGKHFVTLPCFHLATQAERVGDESKHGALAGASPRHLNLGGAMKIGFHDVPRH